MQIFCSYDRSELIEQNLLNIENNKHKVVLREIYCTLFISKDFNDIKKYFTNEFYLNLSTWDIICGRSSLQSSGLYVKDALKDSIIYVRNIKKCSEEIVRNFCDFISYSYAEVYFEDCNAFLIETLHSKNIGKSVYLDLVTDEITIDYCKLGNNVIINRFSKVNVVFGMRVAMYGISVGIYL